MRCLLLLAGVALAAGAPGAAANNPRPCGRIMIDGGWFAVSVPRGPVVCRAARVSCATISSRRARAARAATA
ncbi:MAG: hypothetical protein QOJ29_4448 [Thermoleophilaceae bacterium]|jgi:hypothetical protein|nr:hypothetical protein [Thermoleophilaceae bacterium]